PSRLRSSTPAGSAGGGSATGGGGSAGSAGSARDSSSLRRSSAAGSAAGASGLRRRSLCQRNATSAPVPHASQAKGRRMRERMLLFRGLLASSGADSFPKAHSQAEADSDRGKEQRGNVNEYEILLMLDPEAPEERHDEIIARTRELIEKGGGMWLSHDSWGRRRLAYEIDHKTDGVYHLVQFDAEPATL